MVEYKKEESYLLLSEDFYSLQAEGKFLGVPSYFIRTTGCNCRCSWLNSDGSITKCDTSYTSWEPDVGYKTTFGELLNKVRQTKAKHVVITGGEPFLQKGLVDIANNFIKNKYNVTIETNGTLYFDWLNRGIFMSISPKLLSANALKNELHEKNNKWIETTRKLMTNYSYQLKFVYNNKKDEEEIENILNILPATGKNVYIMPQGISVLSLKEKSQEIWKMCCEHGWNMSPRLHIDVFGNIKGI